MTHRILDADSVDSFRACANSGDGRDHGDLGSYAIVDGRALCYDCAAPLIYQKPRWTFDVLLDPPNGDARWTTRAFASYETEAEAQAAADKVKKQYKDVLQARVYPLDTTTSTI